MPRAQRFVLAMLLPVLAVTQLVPAIPAEVQVVNRGETAVLLFNVAQSQVHVLEVHQKSQVFMLIFQGQVLEQEVGSCARQ
jgi:hypothetical protein